MMTEIDHYYNSTQALLINIWYREFYLSDFIASYISPLQSR